MTKLLIGVCLALTVAACATQSAVAPNAPAASARTAGCVPASSPVPSDCRNVGAVYTQKDLQRTGVVANPAQALRQLDASITVH